MLNSPKNALVVFACDGQVQHRFCTEEAARVEVGNSKVTGCPATAVVSDGADAEMLFYTNPNFMGHVLIIKARLQIDLRMEPSDRMFH